MIVPWLKNQFPFIFASAILIIYLSRLPDYQHPLANDEEKMWKILWARFVEDVHSFSLARGVLANVVPGLGMFKQNSIL